MYILNDVHYFNSIQDFISNVKNAPKISGRDSSSTDSDDGFYQTKNIEEAWEYLESGYIPKGFESVMESVNRIQANNQKVQTFSDFIGFAPNVPNLLMGVPHTMINRSVQVFQNKIVNVLINSSVSGNTSTDFIREKATEIVKVVAGLEAQGYRVNLYKMIGSSRDNGTSVLGFIKLKSDSERLNLKKLIFPITHPSMQRRLDFRFRECFGLVDVTHSGYGSQRNWNKEYVREHFKKLCAGDFLYANLHDYDSEWHKKGNISEAKVR